MSYSESVNSLMKTEKIKIKSIDKNDMDRYYHVVADDGREFLIFPSTDTANEYAVKLYVEMEDDPQLLFQLRMIGKSIESYAKDMIEKSGAQYSISYDQYQKTFLPNNVVAYRIV